MFQVLLLSQCLYLLTSIYVDGSSVQTGVIMCQRWCERRSWCSEATYDPNSLQCSNKMKKHVSPGQTVILIQHHLCKQCPEHHVCLRTRSGATKCVKDDTTKEFKTGPKSPRPRMSRGLKHSAVNTMLKCHGNIRCPKFPREGMSKRSKHSPLDPKKKCIGDIRYVKLREPRIISDIVYYDLSTKCPLDKHLQYYVSFRGTFRIESFAEKKIYYWPMTLEIDRTVQLKESLSFKVAVTNPVNVESAVNLSMDDLLRGFTVTVDKKSITFKSEKTKSKPRSNVPDRFVVVLDKVQGRLLLGTRKACFAMLNGIAVKSAMIPAIVYPRGHPPNLDKLLLGSIGNNYYDFTYGDLKSLLRRCEKEFLDR